MISRVKLEIAQVCVRARARDLITGKYSAVALAAGDLHDPLVLEGTAWKEFRRVHLVGLRAHAELAAGIAAGAIDIAVIWKRRRRDASRESPGPIDLARILSLR